jgi:hypothetical protein
VVKNVELRVILQASGLREGFLLNIIDEGFLSAIATTAI